MSGISQQLSVHTEGPSAKHPGLDKTLTTKDATERSETSRTTLPSALIYSEQDRVVFCGQLDITEITNPPELAEAIPAVENVAWGVGEARRTLAEALQLARQPVWQGWTLEARSYRWHHAGRAELGL